MKSYKPDWKNISQPYQIRSLSFLFQHKLRQSTSMYKDDGSDSSVAHNGCSDHDILSFNYDIIDSSM